MAQAHKLGLAAGWLKSYKHAIELDSWGQREEAKESYDKLAEALVGELAEASSAEWSKRETKNVQSMAMCVRLRANEIAKGGSDESITLSNIRTLVTVMENLFKADKKFPLNLTTLSEEDMEVAVKDMVIRERRVPATIADEDEDADDGSSTPVASASFTGASSHSHHSSPAKSPLKSSMKGRQILITIDKMGFKDDKLRDSFVDPIITVFVVSGGNILGAQKDTCVATERKDQHIFWTGAGATVTLSQTMESILPGSAIFFEFRHYKKSKAKISVKCWGFIEREDLKSGKHVVELYKKPTDLRHKRLSLLTVKPLYLHLNCEIVSPA
mmetsp:Transcript_45928/g.115148  ORF Transcript_45928/g.115148 Transcript_45928/m.115148 type:complete len:328 (+) Transcript_45928:160-1143(+)|eukprot:CAMPEP_0173441122 /NCGR_PEP_ID=MMETSP1357-20121228/23786_1 /TAXON_ID=77926 /ORGANISM="Hemiselmis rufescens, Strain PCC563" /LENGTH=327 /DNA_ID=CAMNT_0014406677 /DNA_START=160 /DNA_END=1143 /DNA_ORIENTATION=-